MKKILIFLLLVLNYFSSYSQKQGNIWCFGDSAGINFNQQSNPVPIISSVHSRGSCCSIADSSGSLLFYANTNSGTNNTGLVWSKNNSLMQNGDSIVGQAWYNEMCIIPMPDNPNQFYLFSIGVTNGGGGDIGLYYSIIDIAQNSGNGMVVQKNIQLQSFNCDDQVSAIKHGNGRDWWLFFRGNNAPTDTIYSYLISISGISNLIVQKIGSLNNSYIKRMVFAPSGDFVVLTNFSGLIEKLSFDRCTGLFSNPVRISNEFDTPYLGSAAISKNDSVLYVATNSSSPDTSYLIQYNLASLHIELTKDTIYTYTYPPSVYEIGLLKLAPDKKIYVANGYYNGVQSFFPYADSMYNFVNMNLSVINQPNNLGASCDFQPYSFFLGGKRSYLGLPNNPDYELGPIQGSLCDTITSVDLIEKQATATLNIFYHSSWQTAFINASGLKGTQLKLIVMDISGRVIDIKGGVSVNGFFSCDLTMDDFSSGLYLITIVSDKEKLTGKMVKP